MWDFLLSLISMQSVGGLAAGSAGLYFGQILWRKLKAGVKAAKTTE
jgi:hypothetical protein